MFRPIAVSPVSLAIVYLGVGMSLHAAGPAAPPAGAPSGSPPSKQLKVQLPTEVRPFPEPLRAGAHPGFKLRGIKGWDWTPQQYLDEIPVMAQYKMNFLMNCYSSLFSVHKPRTWKNEWWKPLPEETKQAYAGVIRSCREYGITFCFSAHPQFMSPRPLDPNKPDDIDNFYQHYQWAQSQGVQWFNIQLDDVSWGEKGPAVGGAEHAKLVNTILARLREKDPAAQMIFCPVPYAGDGTQTGPHEYLTALGKDLHKDVYVVWTGDQVVAPRITRKAAESYKSVVRHRLFLWDNYPVNDFSPSVMRLGPVTGRDADLSEVVEGYASNPLAPQTHINRVAMLTCADYAFNPKAYDPDRSIGQAIAHLSKNDAQREALKDLTDAFAIEIHWPVRNPVMEEFHRRLAADPTHKKAEEYVRGIESLAARFAKAFAAGEFDDAKATLQLNIALMNKELAPRKKAVAPRVGK